MPRHLLLAGCAALLAACTTAEETAFNPGVAAQPASATAPVAAPDYVRMAAAADLFEIQSSQIALQRSQNANVRSFADTMINHHTATSNQLKTAVREAGLPPPPMALPADKQQQLSMLQNAPAASFDEAYLRAQLAAHQEALNLHRSYAGSGEVKPLQDLASAAVPIIEGHYEHARTLSNTAGSGQRNF